MKSSKLDSKVTMISVIKTFLLISGPETLAKLFYQTKFSMHSFFDQFFTVYRFNFFGHFMRFIYSVIESILLTPGLLTWNSAVSKN